MQQLILNFQNDMEATGGMMTSSSPVASRNFANPTQSPENNSVPKTPGTSGRTCLEQFGNHARAGLWAKTLAGLLIGQTGWFSSRCALIWKLKGTKYNRLYFRLAVSTPRTDVIGFGLLPTPTVTQMGISEDRIEKRTAYREAVGRHYTPGNLLEQLQGLLPTPTVGTATGGQNPESGGQMGLGYMARKSLLPTPLANDAKGKENSPSEGLRSSLSGAAYNQMLPTPTADDNPAKNTGKQNQDGLQKRAFQETGQTSQLNPRFVESMMGFPNQWLEI